MSFLGNLRDKAVESIIRKNETVLRFGDIEEISIDSDARIAEVRIVLRGENSATMFRGYYGFDDGEKGPELVVNKITCERVWINEALRMAMDGRTLRFAIADYSGDKLAGIAGGIAKILF